MPPACSCSSARTRRGRKALLAAAVVLNLGALAFFKYTGLVLDTLRLIPALSWLPAVSIPLPIGISFYTFQAMSYVIDGLPGGLARPPGALWTSPPISPCSPS